MSNKIDTPKRLRQTIKHDAINPHDYQNYKIPMACEDCTHFSVQDSLCTIGCNSTPHRKELQQKTYLLCGKVAICRFIEID